MGQFKPMVKMMTTEPSVVLKLKKGGHVGMKKGGKPEHGHKKMADGGMMGGLDRAAPTMAGPTANVSPMARAMMMKKRKGMGRPMIPPTTSSAPMKEGGKADMSQDKAMIKKAFKQHDMQEHKGGKGTDLKLKKGGKAYATGGVVMGQGGFKSGGIIKSTKGETKMVTASTKKYAKGGGVNGNISTTPPGVTNTTTGDVRLGNAGGFKKGGAAKKPFATGGKVDSGAPVAMPQGAKKPTPPVSIDRLAGTFKKGGKVC